MFEKLKSFFSSPNLIKNAFICRIVIRKCFAVPAQVLYLRFVHVQLKYRGCLKSLYLAQIIIIELGKVTYDHPCISMRLLQNKKEKTFVLQMWQLLSHN